MVLAGVTQLVMGGRHWAAQGSLTAKPKLLPPHRLLLIRGPWSRPPSLSPLHATTGHPAPSSSPSLACFVFSLFDYPLV